MTRDLLWALRWLSKNPWFLAAVIAILGLGIGANTAIFSIADAVLLRPPPYQSAKRLVRIEEQTPKWEMSVNSPEDFRIWEDRRDLFDKTVPYRRDIATLLNADIPDQVFAVRTSAQLFSLLGVPAHLGRTLLDSDDASNGPEFGRDQRPLVAANVRCRPARDRPHHHVLRRSLHHRGRDAAGIRVPFIAGRDVDSAAPERRFHRGAGSGGPVERRRHRRPGSKRNADCGAAD